MKSNCYFNFLKQIPDNGESPQFVLVVHMRENEDNNESIYSGWVVLRKLQDFQDLHRKLRQLCSNVKNLDLPSQPLKFFGKSDKNTLDKTKIQIQKYLNVYFNIIKHYIYIVNNT